MFTLLLCGALLGSVVVFRRPEARAAARSGALRGVRSIRISAGEYSIRDLVAQMLDLAEASALPSVSKTYLPTDYHFVISADDAARWDGLLEALVEEIGELIVDRAREKGHVMRGVPTIKLTVGEVRPGRVELRSSALTSRAADEDRTRTSVAWTPPVDV